MEVALSCVVLGSDVDHHLQCPAIQLAMQEFLKMILRNPALKTGRDEALFFCRRISSQQASILIIPFLVVVARRVFQQCPQTP